MKEMPNLSDKDINRFWSKVKKTNAELDCWEWIGTPDHKGYGRFSYGAKMGFLATRISYFINTGIDPGKLFACHTCDNPICVNPKHLFLGTQKQNIDDMITKERGFKRNGENHGNSKFTDGQVIEMRKMGIAGESRDKICTKFNVSKSTLCNILQRKAWFHI